MGNESGVLTMSERRVTIRTKAHIDPVQGTHVVVDNVGVGCLVDRLDSLQRRIPGTEWVFFPWHMVVSLSRPWEDVEDAVKRFSP